MISRNYSYTNDSNHNEISNDSNDNKVIVERHVSVCERTVMMIMIIQII